MSTQPSHPPLDSATLYRDCQSHDQITQERAYRVLWGYLNRIALSLVYDQDDGNELAADCAQDGLIRIHQRIQECREPNAFLGWAKRIVSNLTIDVLRRRRRRQSLLSEANDEQVERWTPNDAPKPGEQLLTLEGLEEIRTLLNQAPISDRSRRLVCGRYLDDQADEDLAKTESEISGEAIRPSHLQVTRSKNMSKLRKWERLKGF